MLGPMLNLFFPDPTSSGQGNHFDAMNQSLSGLSDTHKKGNKNAFQPWMEPPPITPIQPLKAATSVQGTQPVQNPFMIQPGPGLIGAHGNLQGNGATLNTKAMPKDFGVNKPLEKPMFFGYHNDKPLMVGQKLFISC